MLWWNTGTCRTMVGGLRGMLYWGDTIQRFIRSAVAGFFCCNSESLRLLLLLHCLFRSSNQLSVPTFTNCAMTYCDQMPFQNNTTGRKRGLWATKLWCLHRSVILSQFASGVHTENVTQEGEETLASWYWTVWSWSVWLLDRLRYNWKGKISIGPDSVTERRTIRFSNVQEINNSYTTMKPSPTCIQIPSYQNYNQEVRKLRPKLDPECDRLFITFHKNLNSNFM